MLLTRAEIAARIPHGEPMCMLDAVVSYDETNIECLSYQFAHASHPLDAKHQIAPELLIEYSAQAAALHASLNQKGLGSARPAYLGAIKEIELIAPVLENQTPLTISAECLLSSGHGAIYTVEVKQAEQIKMTGRLLLNQPEN